MSYFIGIVPPDKIYHKILNIQQQFGDNKIEPHITIRPPVNPLYLNEWINSATEVANKFYPFNITLNGTGKFRKDVLFISMQSEKLILLQQQLQQALQPFEPVAKYAQNTFHPHLTLGRMRCGFTSNDFDEMEKLTQQWLSEYTVSFPVYTMRIYIKSSPVEKFKKLVDIPFKVE